MFDNIQDIGQGVTTIEEIPKILENGYNVIPITMDNITPFIAKQAKKTGSNYAICLFKFKNIYA